MPPEPKTARQPTAPVKKSVRVRDVPAVTRSIAILRLLGRTNQALGVKAIADELGLVPSTCLHILRVLVSEELVKLEPGTKHYALGSGMISLARSVLKGGSFAQLAQPGLDRLASSFGVTAMGVEVTPKQTVVVLAGRTGGKLAAMLRETDVLISVPHDRAARVREVHALVLHCLSDGVDAQLLGEQENPL